MNVHAIHLPNQARCFLIDSFLPQSHLASIHEICEAFSKESAAWQNPEWTTYRYIYQGNTPEWQSVVDYLKVPNPELTQALGYTVTCDEVL